MHPRIDAEVPADKLIHSDPEIKAVMSDSHCLEDRDYSLEPDYKLG